MYQLAKLVVINYQPKELEEGMMFAMDVHLRTWDDDISYLHVHTLDKVPRDQDEYIRRNGFPVHMYLIAQEQANPDVSERILAYPHQIGWFDDGNDTDVLRTIDIDDINNILMNEGYVMVDVDSYGEPIMEMEQVVLCSHIDDEDDEEWDVTLTDGLDQEPWDEQSNQ